MLKVCFVLACCWLATVNCANILCLMSLCPKSHYNVYVPLAKALADRGHHVTFMSPYKGLNYPGIVEIQLMNSQDSVASVQKNIFEYLIGKDEILLSTFKHNIKTFCHAFVTEEATQQLVKGNKKYDLVIVDGVVNECAVIIAPLVAKYVISLNPTGQVPWASTSTPEPLSFVPMVTLPYPSRMTFFQRMWNVWTRIKFRTYYLYSTIPLCQKEVDPYIPQAPTFEEATRHIALTLTNTDPVLFSTRPQTPDVVAVGGMHCRPSKPLPQLFADFVEKAKEEGVILFTLGSVVPAKDLPPHIRDAFVAAFARLKQMVIWKFEDTIANLPPNVMTTSWMPQQDLLGHNQTRLFISHGGLLSSQEAVYHGVPTIGIPLFYDQIGNVARMQELKIGETLPLTELTEENIYNTIQKVLTDNSYSVNMKTYSSIIRDQPQSPTDRAVYWTEYVIRHKGAPHLRSPALELSFIEYFLLDVAAFVVIALLAIVVIATYSIRYCINYFERPVKKKLTKRISYPKDYSPNISR